jgi:putative phage-type endonuclease
MRPFTRVDVTSDTPEWEAERMHSVGASEVPAIMGLSPYGGTATSTYRAKKGIGKPFDPVLGFIGHASEAIIHQWVIQFAADSYPEYRDHFAGLRRGFMARSRSHPWVHASFDRVSYTDKELVTWQFKTAHQYVGHHWEEGVPVDVEAQVQTEIFVAGTSYAFVVVWIGGREFKLYRIERNTEWIEGEMLPAVTSFWHDNVLANVEPLPMTRAEVAERYASGEKGSRVKGSTAVLEAVDQRAVLLADKKLIDAELEPLDVAIGNYMQGIDTLLDKHDQPVLTYRSQSGRRSVDLAKLENDYPDVFPHVVKTGDNFMVLRTVAPKKEKTQ